MTNIVAGRDEEIYRFNVIISYEYLPLSYPVLFMIESVIITIIEQNRIIPLHITLPVSISIESKYMPRNISFYVSDPLDIKTNRMNAMCNYYVTLSTEEPYSRKGTWRGSFYILLYALAALEESAYLTAEEFSTILRSRLFDYLGDPIQRNLNREKLWYKERVELIG